MNDTLTTLDATKHYMRIDADSHDALLTELIDQVSQRICKICSRKFVQHSLTERHIPGAMGYLVMHEYPIISVSRICDGEDNDVEQLETDLLSGTLRVEPSGSRMPVTVEYEAGYDVIPEDLAMVAHEIISQAFHLGTRDTSLRGETVGSYSYWLANTVDVSGAQYARLRGYMNVATEKGVPK